MDFKQFIKDVPDFPEPGILFRDITPLLGDQKAWRITVETMSQAIAPLRPDYLVGMESRGFIFAAPVAAQLGAGFVPIRKPGRLPRKVFSQDYSLEYRTDRLEVHQDCFAAIPGGRVVIVDDVIATGGTAKAAADLMDQAGGQLVGFCFLVELSFLQGRTLLPSEVPVISLVHY